MRILIVGGGIAGLAAAVHLHPKHDVTLIDKRTSWEANGYVMGIWSGLTQSLDQFGFREGLKTIGYPSTQVTIPNSSGQVLRVFDFSRLTEQFAEMYLVYRPKLHALLRDIARIPIHMGISVNELIEDETGVNVVFTDGNRARYDMVIGADGVHSQVRQLLWPGRTARLSGLHYWIYMAEKDATDPKDSMMLTTSGKVVGLYPSKEDTLCVIFAVRSSDKVTYSGSGAFLQHTFGMFGGTVPRVLKELEMKHAIFHDEIQEVRYTPWYSRRIVLLGDAAHAFPPTVAMGASLAIEDAAVLAQVVQAHIDLPSAFAQYMNLRMDRINRIRRTANFYTALMKADNDLLTFTKETVIKYVPQALFFADITYLLKRR